MNTLRTTFGLCALLISALMTAPACGDDGGGSTESDVTQSDDASSPEADGESTAPQADASAEQEAVGPAVGTTWSIDVSEATWVTPQDVEDLVELMTADYPVLLGISGSSAGSIDMILGTGEATGQIMCNRTVEATGLTLAEDGSLNFTAESFSLANGLTMVNMTISAVVDAGSGDITSLDSQGHVVMSSIPADLLTLNEGQTACDLTEGLGMPCTTCPSEPATGGPADCIEVQVTGLKGSVVSDLSLVPITEADCHPECAENSEECDTTGW